MQKICGKQRQTAEHSFDTNAYFIHIKFVLSKLCIAALKHNVWMVFVVVGIYVVLR